RTRSLFFHLPNPDREKIRSRPFPGRIDRHSRVPRAGAGVLPLAAQSNSQRDLPECGQGNPEAGSEVGTRFDSKRALMLTLVTSNPAKSQPFSGTLERLRIGLEKPRQAPLERQTLSFAQALEDKARGMAALYGHPVLVDDAGLVLDAYPGFPGPLTSVV